LIKINPLASQFVAIKQEEARRANIHLPSAWLDSGPHTALRADQATLYDDCLLCVMERGPLQMKIWESSEKSSQ
jgi:hypothetical protein